MERFGVPRKMPPWVRHEHLARYRFAAMFVREKIVVDAACGEGAGSRLFAQSGAKAVEGFDVSAEAIVEARRSCDLPNLRFRQSDCLRLPLENDFADVYISLESIEHIREDSLFLEEVVRVLKPEGTFICSTPNRRFTNPGTRITDRPFNPFHVREYNKEEFLDLLGGYFGQVRLFGQNPVTERRRRRLERLSSFLPPRALLWLSRCSKVPLLFRDRYEDHEVQDGSSRDHEYLLAVCSKPLRGRPR